MPALDGGCCTKQSAKTWATLVATAAEGLGASRPARARHGRATDLRLFRPYPQNGSSEPPGFVQQLSTTKSRSPSAEPPRPQLDKPLREHCSSVGGTTSGRGAAGIHGAWLPRCPVHETNSTRCLTASVRRLRPCSTIRGEHHRPVPTRRDGCGDLGNTAGEHLGRYPTHPMTETQHVDLQVFS